MSLLKLLLQFRGVYLLIENLQKKWQICRKSLEISCKIWKFDKNMWSSLKILKNTNEDKKKEEVFTFSLECWPVLIAKNNGIPSSASDKTQ